MIWSIRLPPPQGPSKRHRKFLKEWVHHKRKLYQLGAVNEFESNQSVVRHDEAHLIKGISHSNDNCGLGILLSLEFEERVSNCI
jgi:hypothetical protein